MREDVSIVNVLTNLHLRINIHIPPNELGKAILCFRY